MSPFNNGKPSVFIVLVLALFFAIGFVTQWLHRDMLLWRAVAPFVGEDAANQFQSALFKLHRRTHPRPVLTIGDGLFLQAMRGRHPSDSADEIRMNALHPPSLTEFFNELPAGMIRQIVLQQSPLHWSNAAFRQGGQRFDYWHAFKADGYRIYPLNDARLLFKAFLDAATADESWKKSTQTRPTNLDELRFRADRAELGALKQALHRHAEAGTEVVWMLDLRVYDLDSNAPFFQTLLNRYAVLAREGSFIDYRVIDEECLKRDACP